MTSDLDPLAEFIEATLFGDWYFVGFGAHHSFSVQHHCCKYITYICVLTANKTHCSVTVLCHEKLNLEVNMCVTHHSPYDKTLFHLNDSEAVILTVKKVTQCCFKSNCGMFFYSFLPISSIE